MITKTITFSDRRVNATSIKISNEGDNNAERIKFVLPARLASASVFLFLSIENHSDVVMLDDERTFTPERKHTQYPGRWTAYLEAQQDGDVVWHSDPFGLIVGDLPDTGERIEQAYPTAVEQAMKAAAEAAKVTGMTARAVELPAGAEPTADYADGVLTIGIPLGGDVSEAQVAQAVADYLAAHPIKESDPTVPAWAKAEQKPSYTASEVGADPSGTAAAQVAAHNTGPDTHSDIRLLIQGLSDRLNALADSDDTTLDQLSEVVAYIKSNRDLISAITTDKVSVADIIDNLTTNVANKPLSAAQGVALKALIDAITIPEALPNPNALTFTGAVTGSYDGSAKMSARIPQVVSWANKELFNKDDLVDPGNLNSFVTVDGVEYYRYHAGGTNGFTWNNPYPLPGSVTITARGVSQYGGSRDTRLKTIYDDGTYGPDLYIVVSGESKTATVTTDASKTLAKITGNYDLENWVLLDMSVMSIVANYNVGVPLADSNVPGGIKADPATETDTVPARIGADGKLYVPEMSGGGGGTASGDYIPIPQTAAVGQTIVVKSVDENGKPTDWAAADMEKPYSIISQGDISEDVSILEFTGIAGYDDFLFVGIMQAGNTSGVRLQFNGKLASVKFGSYFVHNHQKLAVAHLVIDRGLRIYFFDATSQEYNSPYNQDSCGNGVYGQTLSEDNEITSFGFLMDDGKYIKAGSSYVLYGR